jgi:hypothetical protein
MQMVDQCVLNLRRESVLRFMIEHPHVRESAIVADAYELNTPSNWVSPLYHQASGVVVRV